jgi:trehalose 6-phosphate phosphatase
MAEATPPSSATPPPGLLEGAALFLDFDGTLVELAATPGAVSVDAGLTRLLTALSHCLDGRLAIVSGRPVETLRELLPPALVMVGSHGLEFATADGAIDLPLRPAAFAGIVEHMARLAARHPGLIVEDKPLGAALHYRQSPEAEAACLELAAALAAEHDLHLQPGKMMVEVRTPGGDKGTAIERLMREPDMRGTRPVFMGDDLTDEPGFGTAARLGGAGVLVGPERATRAQYRVDGVPAAIAWLESFTARAA